MAPIDGAWFCCLNLWHLSSVAEADESRRRTTQDAQGAQVARAERRRFQSDVVAAAAPRAHRPAAPAPPRAQVRPFDFIGLLFFLPSFPLCLPLSFVFTTSSVSYWVLLVFSGFYRFFFLGFTGFHLVILGITGLCWNLLDLTWFY